MRNTRTRNAHFLTALICLMGLVMLPLMPGGQAELQAQPNAWINEFHYDNIGDDANEFIEIVIENPGLYSLSDFTVHLYNGSSASNAVVYTSTPLSSFTVGVTIGDFTFYHFTYPVDGIQNGDRDGFALSYQGVLIPGQLLSYEGVFTAGSGPASGMTSVNIGVSESNTTTAAGHSLQLGGTGEEYADFTWETPDVATKGTLNNNQSLGQIPFCGDILSFSFPQQTGPAVIDDINAMVTIEVYAGTNLAALVADFTLCYQAFAFDTTNSSYNFVESGITVLDYSDTVYWQVWFGDESATRIWKIVVETAQVSLPAIVINEVDYDMPGTGDNAEFIELKNTGTDPVNLENMKVVLYNGSQSPPTSYRDIILPNVMLAAGDYYVICGNGGNVPNCDLVVNVATNLIENGAPDAIVLYSATNMILDMLSYEGNTTGFTEGSGVDLIDDAVRAKQGISRWPDGVDTDVNNVDFIPLCITPGEANLYDTGYCVCTIFDITVDSVGVCNPATNSYHAFFTITYTKEPTSGYLMVNGEQFPITGSPQTVYVPAWPANGLPIDLSVSFSDDPFCVGIATAAYTAPASCGSCSIQSAVVDYISDCNPVTNKYLVELRVIVQNYPGDSIGVTIGNETRILELQIPGKTPPYYYVTLNGLIANGQTVTILLFNPLEPGCSLQIIDLWTAPQSCFVPAPLVINEIDYDQPGTDNAEFIELKNNGNETVSLAGYRVVLVNGANNLIYGTFDLPESTLAAGDYFVICANAANVPNCDLDVNPNVDLIQNGAPDAVALLDPFGNIVDAVSYEGSVAGYTEGSGVGLIDNGSAAGHGISRYPDGQDTDQNNVDFIYSCATPGESNNNLTGYCGPFNFMEAWVYYDNNVNTPMPFIPVHLYRNNVLIGSDTSDLSGKVTFSDLPNGTYTFVVDPTFYAWGWGGVNSLDALLVAKHFVGMITLSAYDQIVGNVETAQGLNTSDAHLIARRFAGLISSFDVGDWYSVQPPRVINELTDTQIQVDLPIRCYGDVNGSYIPPIKSAGLNYRQEGLVSAQSDIVTLPVSTDQVVRLGAVSLELLMPEKSQVIDVMMADGQQAFFSQDGRILRLAWFSLEGIETGNSHPFMFINLKMETSAADASLEVLSNSSLGDMYGEEMKHIGLIFPGIAANQTGISTYPNPVSQTLNLDININQAQDVSIELFNMLGEKVISVDMGYLTIGLHHHVLDVTTLSKGSYLLRMRGSLESVTHKISISR